MEAKGNKKEEREERRKKKREEEEGAPLGVGAGFLSAVRRSAARRSASLRLWRRHQQQQHNASGMTPAMPMYNRTLGQGGALALLPGVRQWRNQE